MQKNKKRPKTKSKWITAVNKGAKVLKFKASGKTISQAIDAGLKELKVDKNQVEIKVLTKPQNFVLAEVEICVPREVVEKNQHLQNLKKLEVLNAEIHSAEQKLLKSKAEKDSILNGLLEEKVVAVKATTPFVFARDFVAGLLQKLGKESFELEFFEDDNHINISAFGKNLGHLIGVNGARLAHIQYITNMAVSQKFSDAKHVVLDINKYKAKETEKLKVFAQEKAKEVLESGKEIALEPMNAFSRRVVHGVVAEITGLATESRGEEPNRFIVIMPKA